jgi:transcription antitermination factor NusG
MFTADPWFALQTMPKNERKVERLLKQKGYDCFTPIYRSKRKWSDRVVEIDSPLFPGYVFCRFNSSALGKAISTQGVTRVVGFGGAPAEVAREEVEASGEEQFPTRAMEISPRWDAGGRRDRPVSRGSRDY